jgi:hypothetical protein
MSLKTPEHIQKFQKKLYRKAKAEKAHGIDARYYCHVPTVVSLTVKSVGKPDAGKPHVRFDERGWETESW